MEKHSNPNLIKTFFFFCRASICLFCFLSINYFKANSHLVAQDNRITNQSKQMLFLAMSTTKYIYTHIYVFTRANMFYLKSKTPQLYWIDPLRKERKQD